MPITVNENGVLHELTDVTVNEGGTLHTLDTVHANESGVLREIHSGIPRSLTWTADTSKDSAAKINSVSADGMTVTYTCKSNAWTFGNAAVYSNYFSLPAGAIITAEFSNASGGGTSGKYAGIFLETGSAIVNGTQSGGSLGTRTDTLNVTAAGTYRLALHAHSVTGGQSGVNYYSCTATVKITITK